MPEVAEPALQPLRTNYACPVHTPGIGPSCPIMEATSGWARKETIFPSRTDAKYVPNPNTSLPVAGISLRPRGTARC